MATFDDKATIDRLIANDGWLPENGSRDAPDNPPAVRITEYINAFGNKAWGVAMRGERNIDRYQTTSEFVNDPRIIWEKRDA